MITYEVNKADLKYVQSKLKGMESQAPRVIKNAINQTAREARKKLATGAQAAYTVKQAGWNNHMKIQPATTGNLVAVIRANDKPLTLPRFSYRGNKKGKGGSAAAADIVKGGLKEIVGGMGIKAFKANGLIMQRKGKERLPVKVLHSNSVPKMIEKVYEGERGVEGALREPINEALHNHISEQIAKLV